MKAKCIATQPTACTANPGSKLAKARIEQYTSGMFSEHVLEVAAKIIPVIFQTKSKVGNNLGKRDGRDLACTNNAQKHSGRVLKKLVFVTD